MNILLVMNTPDERAWYEEQLYLSGHDATTCATAKMALEYCQQMYFPLIVLDCHVPDIPAEELCRRIRGLPQERYSLIFAIVDPATCAHFHTMIEIGVDDYLLKPVEAIQFRLRLGLLERRARYAHAMEILRTTQSYAGNIVESSLDMIIAVDMRRHIVEFNKAAQEAFGYRLEEVLGKHVDMLYTDAVESATISQTTILQGRCIREIWNKRKNGDLFLCLLSASILRDMYGNPIGIMGISRDITNQKRSEEALKQAHADLERQNLDLARAAKLKDDFLSLISHELRTPLTVILSHAELLHEGLYGLLDETQLASVESIQQSGHRLATLINDMLDFSKLQQGRLELKLAAVAIDRLCQVCLQTVEPQAAEKKLKLTSTLDPAVQHIQADERLLMQVLLNLLRNAVKFTLYGGKVGLDVHGDPAQQAVHFVVWDTGIGIAEEDLNKLFQPFVQLDAGLTREYVGAGLGLSMVCQIINLHGGSIAVESKLGQGSRFTVTVPWN